MKTRINPVTGREEYWNEPPGLPGLWIPRGFCDRCHPFNQCLGLATFTLLYIAYFGLVIQPYTFTCLKT